MRDPNLPESSAQQLLIANHVTWLHPDPRGSTDARSFPGPACHRFQWRADHNGRSTSPAQRSATGDQASAIAAALERPQPLALFPEGTTGPGDQLLPFRSALLSAVAPPAPGVEVRPVAIDYGPAASEVGWHDESAQDNVLKILGREGTFPVIVRLLPPLPPTGDRKLLACQARDQIAAALAASSSAPAGL